MKFELESVCQQGLQPQPHVFWRCARFALGDDVKSIAIEPPWSAFELNLLELVRPSNEDAQRHVPRRESTTRRGRHAHAQIAGLVHLDGRHFESRADLPRRLRNVGCA